MRNSPGDWWQYGAWWPFIMTASSSETSPIGGFWIFFLRILRNFWQKEEGIEKEEIKINFR